MKRTGLKKKKLKKAPPEGMWVRGKNLLEVIKEFGKREKDIGQGDTKKYTGLKKNFLRDVYLYNQKQYFQVSSLILDADTKLIINKLKNSEGLPAVKNEYKSIKSAMSEKEEITKGYDKWHHVQIIREMDGIGREEEFLSQKRLAKLRDCDRRILKNMEMLTEKIDMFDKILKREKEKVWRYIG